jgi:thioredoxin reductase (NADPH)
MHDLIIIGGGPGGIALAAEAAASGLDSSQILILEKETTHNSAIRQLYPEQKLTTANYKGFAARCEGLLCVGDMTKPETLQFFDKIISDYRINIEYNAEVYGMRGLGENGGARFRVESSHGVYERKVLACAIGIFGRPNKPKEFQLPPSLKERLLFDMTSQAIQSEDVLVVGGGDTAAEYVQYLRQQGNHVSLSYRKADFTRLNQQNHDALLTMEKRGEVEILRSSNIKEIKDEAGRTRDSVSRQTQTGANEMAKNTGRSSRKGAVMCALLFLAPEFGTAKKGSKSFWCLFGVYYRRAPVSSKLFGEHSMHESDGNRSFAHS